MGIRLKPEYLARYRDVAGLLFKYGRSDLVKRAGLESIEFEDGSDSPREQAEATALADDLERMGPTFIKLGQLLSTRPDILPKPYLEALSRLQDRVRPFSFADVERTVSDELGVRISKAFGSFDAEPLAAASLGQVHRATLRDGREVVVKVQRPGIRQRVVQDLEVLADIADFLDAHTEVARRYGFRRLLEEFRRSLFQELDYRQEARNLVTLRVNLEDYPNLRVPSAIDDYTTSRVLTMEFIGGTPITRLSPLARLELDGAALADELFRAYLQQILVDGFFHADPHPGNILMTDDGKIAMLDLGMVAHVSPRLQESLIQLLLAIAEGRSDDAVTYSLRIGERRGDFDEAAYRERISYLVAQHQGVSLDQVEVGRAVLEVTRVAAELGVQFPTELLMLGKTLLNLDQVGWSLDPDFDPNAAIRRHATELLEQRLAKTVTPGNLLSGALEMKDFLERLPGRVNQLLDAVVNNELEVKVHAIDEQKLMSGFQKVANRITMGLILAALIVGASQLMQVHTQWTILGYPGLAMIFFVIAAAGGVVLMLSIFFKDD